MRTATLTLTLTALCLALPPAAPAQWPTSPYQNLQLDNQQCMTPLLMCSDGNGGAIILWNNFEGFFIPRVMGQHVDAYGNKLWGEWGLTLVPLGWSEILRGCVSDGEGGAYFSVIIVDPAADIYAFRIDGNGNHLWGENGILVTNLTISSWDDFMQLVPDGSGGVIIAWAFNPFGGSTPKSVFAQRINAIGQILWTENGVALFDTACYGADLFRIAPDATWAPSPFTRKGNGPPRLAGFACSASMATGSFVGGARAFAWWPIRWGWAKSTRLCRIHGGEPSSYGRALLMPFLLSRCSMWIR